MSSVSSTSSSSSSSSSSKTYSYSSSGLSGLISGLDTETMVKKMLAGTQTKIDKQNQQKQILTWKQTMYRTAISDINTFKSKYFDSAYDSTLKTNLSSSKFFNAKTSTVSSGSAVTVNSTDYSADVGSMTFNVKQLATATKLSSSVLMSSSNSITGSAVDLEALKTTLASGDITFDMSLDGVSKEITLSASDFSGTSITASDLSTVLSSKTTDAFGTYVKASVDSDTNKVTFKVNINGSTIGTDGTVSSTNTAETGHELSITGSSAKNIGITPGSSSLLSGSTTLGSLSGISGSNYSFSINGKSFNFASTDTVATVINKVNSSSAGVRLSYSSATDSFSMEATSTGAQYGISVQQDTGNLLSVMFGSDQVSTGASLEGSALNAGSISSTALSGSYTTTGSKLAMTVNGTSYSFSLDSGTYTTTELGDKLNTWLTSTFGTQSDGSTANISYDASTGAFSTAAGYSLSFAKTGVVSTDSTASSNLAVAMGLAKNGASNAVTSSSNISDIPALSGMTGVSFLKSDGTAATTLGDIASISDGTNSYTVAFDSTSSSLKLSGTSGTTVSFDSSTTAGKALASYFGSSYTFGDATTTSDVTTGKDLIVSINGTQTSRSSNTFTLDGLTVTAKTLSGTEDTVIDTTRDTSSVVSAIKSFVSDYNTLVSGLYSKITEDYTYQDYAPLTDAQKEEMSDSEITAWETKAKTGLLRNDSTISTFLQEMDSALYTTVDGAGIAAYSIGIETSSTSLSGQLTLDESALTSALATDPDAVAKLFTDSTSGVATMFTKAIDNAAKLSSASPGALVQLAGADGWTTNAKTNDIYLELQTINDKLDDLQDKYDDEKERYWTKFNSMETTIANYQSQSSMISSSFSS